MTQPTRKQRLEARRRIVQAANLYAARRRRLAPYTMRHLERCVAIVRRAHLVPPKVLEVAGYRPEQPR